MFSVFVALCLFASIVILTIYLINKRENDKKIAREEKISREKRSKEQSVTSATVIQATPPPTKKEGVWEKCKCVVRDHKNVFLSLLLVVLNIIFFYIYYWEAIPYVGEEYFPNLHISWLYFWATISIGFFTLVPYYFILADFFKPSDNLWNGYRLISCVAPFIILFFILQNPSSFFDKQGNPKVWIYEQNGEIKEVYWYNRGRSQKYGAELRAIHIGDVDDLQKKVFSFENWLSSFWSSSKEKTRLTLLEQGYIWQEFKLTNELGYVDFDEVICPDKVRYCIFYDKDPYTLGSPVTKYTGYEATSKKDFSKSYWVHIDHASVAQIKAHTTLSN